MYKTYRYTCMRNVEISTRRTNAAVEKHNNNKIIESATLDDIHTRLRKTKANNIMVIFIIIGATHKRASELGFARSPMYLL